MTWWKGDYSIPFPGATGGRADPDRVNKLIGAWRRGHLNADATDDHQFRTAYAGRETGQAASLPPEVVGQIASDKTHNRDLDGHPGSVIANHPDGRFALNTAATSDNSRHANFEVLLQDPLAAPFTATGRTLDALRMEWVEPPRGSTKTYTVDDLRQVRKDRLWDQPELQVKDAPTGGLRVASLLGQDWSGSQLALGAIGLYAAYSAVAA